MTRKININSWLAARFSITILVICRLCFQADAMDAPDCAQVEESPDAITQLQSAPSKIKIFVTNDVHGYIYKDTAKKRIGYALLKGHIDAARREGYHTILMDAGDAFSGNINAQFDSGRSVAAIMGKMGYRVLSPGNHAFDFDAFENDPLYYSNTLLKILRDHSPHRVAVTCINGRFRNEPIPGTTTLPVIVHGPNSPDFEGEDLRIIVFGVITPYVSNLGDRIMLEEYDFGIVGPDSAPDHRATRENILRMAAEAARPYDRPGDVVLVLSHLGMDGSHDYAQGQITGRDLAAVPNVDMVADSHSHNYHPPEKVGDAYYGIAGRYLDHFFEITLTKDQTGPRFEFEIKDFDSLAGVQEDEEILDNLRLIADRLGLGERLFEVEDDTLLTDNGIKERNTPLGRLICRTMAGIAETDLALYNCGGIRAGLSEGWVTVGDIYNVMPFLNNLVVHEMTGSDLFDLFGHVLRIGTNGFPQFYGVTVFAGMEDGTAPMKIAGILDHAGEPLQSDAVYRVAVNSFMEGGGDGYRIRLENKVADLGDCSTQIIRFFRETRDPKLEELRFDNSLLIFDSREDAENAYENAVNREERIPPKVR